MKSAVEEAQGIRLLLESIEVLPIIDDLRLVVFEFEYDPRLKTDGLRLDDADLIDDFLDFDDDDDSDDEEKSDDFLEFDDSYIGSPVFK